MRRCLIWMVVCAWLGGNAAATVPMVNGTLIGDEAFYGPALSIQDTDTGFGNALNGDPRFAFGGSELDQVFGTVRAGRLYLLVTGNLESNFNKLSVLVDSVPGGVNQIVGSTLPVAVDAFCCGGFGTTDGALQRMDGMKFDAGFNADYFLTFSNGTESVGAGGATQFWALTAHYAQLNNGTAGTVARIGMRLDPHGSEFGLGVGVPVDQDNNGWATPYGGGTPAEHEFVESWDPMIDPTNSRNHRDMKNSIGLQMAIDNSNTQGVDGGFGFPWTTLGNPQDVVTGIEFSIPLAALGNPTPGTQVKVMAFINGNGHHYASNQFSGKGIEEGNLGGDGFGGFTGNLQGVDLSVIPGDQFVLLTVPRTGDFNGDGLYNCADINALTNAVAMGGSVATFDLNGDGQLTILDVDFWRSEAGGVNLGLGKVYRVGDANLDGVVDGSDFGLWNSAKFTPNKDWCSGNFNADSVTDGSDFGLWNANKFTSSDGASVPEPVSLGWLLIVLAGCRRYWRRA